MDAVAAAIADLDPSLLECAIRRLDFNRTPAGTSPRGPGHKEWLHFCVYGEGLDLLLNFSLVEDVSSAATGRIGRLVTLARHQRWVGSVSRFSPDQIAMPGGRVGLSFGDNEVRFVDGRYLLRARVHSPALEVDLELVPACTPAPLFNVAVEDGPPINWAVVPRLFANGTVRFSGRTHTLSHAAAYHDHNFGTFRWGTDFAWEWGYCLPPDPSSPWAIVAVRLSNRAHTRVFSQGLLVWHRGRQVRLFINRELSVRHDGLLRPSRVTKIPAAMALVKPGHATDVPRRIVMEGERQKERALCVFECEDVAQVIIPNDDDLGVTVVQEIKGRFYAEGTINGESLKVEGGGVFELLGS